MYDFADQRCTHSVLHLPVGGLLSCQHSQSERLGGPVLTDIDLASVHCNAHPRIGRPACAIKCTEATENDGNQQAVGQAAEPTAAAPVEQAENL